MLSWFKRKVMKNIRLKKLSDKCWYLSVCGEIEGVDQYHDLLDELFMIPDKHEATIIISLNSNGGRTDTASAIVNHTSHFNKSIGVAVNLVESAAFSILTNCDELYIGMSSKIMQHPSSLCFSGYNTTNFLKDRVMNTENEHRRVLDAALVKHPNLLTTEQYNDTLEKDVVLNPKDIIDNNTIFDYKDFNIKNYT